MYRHQKDDLIRRKKKAGEERGCELGCQKLIGCQNLVRKEPIEIQLRMIFS